MTLLDRVDALVFPGQSVPAQRFENLLTNRVIIVPGSHYTNVWNLLGLPAVVVPGGFRREGLPVSIQIVGRPFDEATVLRIARAYEGATDWHTRRPDPAKWTLESGEAYRRGAGAAPPSPTSMKGAQKIGCA
jgi:aspartyl-tRNA(Asn)/glutamyl-tRNA(Gln) amidotransferase subunit A